MSWRETLDFQKSSLRWDIKRTMKSLCKRLADIGEECFVVTVNINNGWVGHMGSVYGDDFIHENLHIPYQFLNYCRESVEQDEILDINDRQSTARNDDGDKVDVKRDKDESRDKDDDGDNMDDDEDDDDDNDERIRIEVMPESPDDPILQQEEGKDINVADETGETPQPVKDVSAPKVISKSKRNQSPSLVKKTTPKKGKLTGSSRSPQKYLVGVVNPKPLYYCSLCHVTFKQWKQFRSHTQRYNHKENEKKYKVCHKCKSRFVGTTNLFNHMMRCQGRRETRIGVNRLPHNPELNDSSGDSH